jgi:hypothetical protein
MGASLARPTGQKAAKKSAMTDKLEEKRVNALFTMAQAQVDLAASVELSATELLFHEFKMYKEMGMMEEATQVMAQLKELKQKQQQETASASVASVSVAAQVPAVVFKPTKNTESAGDETSELEILEEDLTGTNSTALV